MRYRPMGRSGLMVSIVGLGSNNFGSRIGLDETRAVVDAALDAGVTLVDTADVYGNRGGSEALLGEVLKGRREEVVLATKFGMDMGGTNAPDWGARGSRRYIRRAVEASLERLQTDWIDLYQYHIPDGVTPMDETLGALDDLVREGKVCYIGSSNFAGWQVADAEAIAHRNNWNRYISAQNSYSLLDRSPERDLVPACVHYGIGVLPYFPLANGILTGKYRRGEAPSEGTRLASRGQTVSDRQFDVLDALEEFARQRGISLLHVAIGGLAGMPAVASVIAGATRPEQVRANAEAGEWQPTPEDLAALNAIVGPGRRVS